MSVEDAFREALKKDREAPTSDLVREGLYNRYSERKTRREKRAEEEQAVPRSFPNIFSRLQFFLKLLKK